MSFFFCCATLVALVAAQVREIGGEGERESERVGEVEGDAQAWRVEKKKQFFFFCGPFPHPALPLSREAFFLLSLRHEKELVEFLSVRVEKIEREASLWGS